MRNKSISYATGEWVFILEMMMILDTLAQFMNSQIIKIPIYFWI